MATWQEIWRSRAISPPLKARLFVAEQQNTMALLVWPILTYGAEAWTLSKDLRCSIEAFEMQCYRRSMKISYMEHVTNEEVLERVDQNRKLLAMVKTRKLKYFGHISRHASLENDIMLGTVPGLRRHRSVSNGSMTSQNGQTTQYRT